jgi:hypothetical protein
MLTGPHQPPLAFEIQTESQVLLLYLPDVRSPVQYLIDMGLRPTLARHISSVYMEFVARHRQVFRSYFHRVIRGGCRQPEYCREMFIVQFKWTIQVWESQIMSTVWNWLYRAGLSPTAYHPQCMDVSATFQNSLSWDKSSRTDTCGRCHEGRDSFKTRSQTNITGGRFGHTFVYARLIIIRLAWTIAPI